MFASAHRAGLAGPWLALAVAAGCGGGGGGGGSGPKAPVVTAIDPDFGYAEVDTAVTITGDNFLTRVTDSGLDTRHQAWLGGAALRDVTWVDVHTLHATVPAGMSAGMKSLKVRNAYGRDGTLANAFTVLVPAGLGATVTASRDTADEDQEVAVTLTVVNGGGGGAATARIDTVTPRASVTAGGWSCTDPTPTAAQTIGAGESVEFHWTCQAGSAGRMTLWAEVAGEEVVSHNPLSATATSDQVDIQTEASLQAALSIEGITPPANVNVGQQLNVTVTVSNSGTGAASITTVSPVRDPATRASCDTPSPPTPFRLEGETSQDFTFTCTAGPLLGALSLGTTVSGASINTTDELNPPVTPAALTVQSPAAPAAVMLVTPVGSRHPGVLAVDTGQTLNVTFSVVAGGVNTAGLAGVTVEASQSGTGSADCTAVSPSAPQDIPASQSRQFTWTCTGTGPGTLTLSGTASGTDANDHTPIDPGDGVDLTMQKPAALSVETLTSPASANVNEPVSVVLTVLNGDADTAPARITALTPTPTGTPGIGCAFDAPAPTFPVVVAGGATSTFTWTCTAGAAGAYELGARVTADDANWTAVAAATISAPANPLTVSEVPLTGELTVSPNPAAAGGEITMSLVLTNPGDATARVATDGVTATVDDPGGAGFSCTSPVLPATLDIAPRGNAEAITWTCTAGSSGATATLGASVAAIDLVSGDPLDATVVGQEVTVE